MTKSHTHFTWIKNNYQHNNYQSVIFSGCELNSLSPLCILTNHFVNSIDLSFFDQYYKANKITGGRPNLDYKIMLKIYMYSLYSDISCNKLEQYNSLGSELNYLSHGIHHFPKSTVFSKFLKVLDNHIDDIFYMSIAYLKEELELDVSTLFCDGTVFEANNSRHKVVTVRNIDSSNIKWNKVLNDKNSTQKQKETALEKLKLNIKRADKLKELGRTSYGRTDEDCVLLKDKNGSYIAGFNVQFVEEKNYGFVIYAHISNKNPDSAAFLEMLDDLVNKYKIKYIVLDAGYGSPKILIQLDKHNIKPVVKTVKNANTKKSITEYSFQITEDEEYLVCPEGRKLWKLKVKDDGKTRYKANDCSGCKRKSECCKRGNKVKSLTINATEHKLVKVAKEMIESELGKRLYAQRANICESPNGYIKHNLNGKKLKMKGLIRNNTNMKLYGIIYNLSRLITIKSEQESDDNKTQQ